MQFPPSRAQSGLARRLLDLLVPPACLACQLRLDGTDAVCGRCWQSVTFIRPPLCDRLGLPLPFGDDDDGPQVSAAAAAAPPAWQRARSVALYENGSVMTGLIHQMKYGDRLEARRLFARWLIEAGHALIADADLIVPVPMTRWRLAQRRFNQSALLAREVARLTDTPCSPQCLVKTRNTAPQVQLTGTARRINLRGAFAVPPRRQAALVGRRILLLDDVMTTGATADACTRALLAAGAGAVDVLTLARVPAPPHMTV